LSLAVVGYPDAEGDGFDAGTPKSASVLVWNHEVIAPRDGREDAAIDEALELHPGVRAVVALKITGADQAILGPGEGFGDSGSSDHWYHEPRLQT